MKDGETVERMAEAAHYYIDRLERVLNRVVVRDLDEARAGYEAAMIEYRRLSPPVQEENTP